MNDTPTDVEDTIAELAAECDRLTRSRAEWKRAFEGKDKKLVRALVEVGRLRGELGTYVVTVLDRLHDSGVELNKAESEVERLTLTWTDEAPTEPGDYLIRHKPNGTPCYASYDAEEITEHAHHPSPSETQWAGPFVIHGQEPSDE